MPVMKIVLQTPAEQIPNFPGSPRGQSFLGCKFWEEIAQAGPTLGELAADVVTEETSVSSKKLPPLLLA